MKRILSLGLALSLSVSSTAVFAQEKPAEKPVEKAPKTEKIEKVEKKEAVSASSSVSSSSNSKSVVIPAKEMKDEDILKGLDYPELQVVPRASDRLLMETQNEREYGWIAFWPYQVSSLATLAAGNRLRGNYRDSGMDEVAQQNSNNMALTAMAVGVGGLGLSIFLIKSDLYGDSFRRIKAYKVTDKRSELFRERLAEEALEKPAQLINTLTTISVSLNLIANVGVLAYSNADVRSYALAGIVTSFLPWWFSNRYVDNWNKQLEYKRKIYTPLIGWDYQYVPQTRQFQPQLTAHWSF